MIDELRFVAPDLRAIDEAPAEVVACSAWEDERPLRGVAGLLDWRMAGRLSMLAKSGFLTGKAGEVVLVPGRPKLPFEKVLVFGLGPRAAFDDEVVRSTLVRLKATLDGLNVKRALVELPGRASDELPIARATELVAEVAPEVLEEQSWTLVDTDEAEASMMERLSRRHDARPRPAT